jgi:hypothetical protein
MCPCWLLYSLFIGKTVDRPKNLIIAQGLRKSRGALVKPASENFLHSRNAAILFSFKLRTQPLF